jgi:hypothetical protein
VDLTDPTRAITSALDGPVLEVLARSGRPLTVGEIAAEAARGSEIGVRRATARLVQQGIVIATQMGRNQVHELNREHVAAPAAEVLAGLRVELWKRLRESLTLWDPRPVHASVFGSAARADGGADSDIDVLLVHRPFTGERLARPVEATSGVFLEMTTPFISPDEEPVWHEQVDKLHGDVLRWTGNHVQVLDLSVYQWWAADDLELFAEIGRDAISLSRAKASPYGRVRSC